MCVNNPLDLVATASSPAVSVVAAAAVFVVVFLSALVTHSFMPVCI